MGSTKIYSLSYLKNSVLSDDDLFNIFETKSLLYSLIVAEFRIIKDKRKSIEILKYVSNTKSWPDLHTWHKKQFDEFISDLTKIYQNVYQQSEEICKSKAQWWVTLYGFRIAH